MAQGRALDGLDSRGARAPVCVSYARRDALDLAGHLAGDLQVRGHRVWIDLDAIEGGGLFDARIEEAIRAASHVLALLTPSAVRDESVCRDEVVFAADAFRELVVEPSRELDHSPALQLPAAAFDDPRLARDCGSCGRHLRFNPYVVDGHRWPCGVS